MTFTRRLGEETRVLLLPARVYRSELNEAASDYMQRGCGRTPLPEALEIMHSWMKRRVQYE